MCCSHQVKNWLQTRAYASRVFRFRILVAKNSKNLVAAFSPALARIAGTVCAWRRVKAFIFWRKKEVPFQVPSSCMAFCGSQNTEDRRKQIFGLNIDQIVSKMFWRLQVENRATAASMECSLA